MSGNGVAGGASPAQAVVEGGQAAAPIDVLQRFRRPRPRPGEVRELCGVDIADQHSHLVNVARRNLVCACRPCYLLFLPGGAGGARYRAVPERFVALPANAVSRSQWEGMQIPVGVAFVFFNSSLGEVVAFYPGPAGATESLLSLEAWQELAAANPALSTLEPDVEALLIRAGRSTYRPGGEGMAGAGTGGAGIECFIVPIDACYELVGHLRRMWRGFDGRQEANQALEEFFAGVRGRARPVPAESA